MGTPTAAAWFNTLAFAQNKIVTGAATEGNSPRNFLDSPGFRDVDLAISRKFRIGERAALTLRGEATNVFNMVSLGTPGATVPATPGTSLTFGVIRTANPTRQFQLGARLTF